MIKLSQKLYKRMKKAAAQALPEEICGLIGGEVLGTDKIIREIYILENTDHSHEHFSMNPKEQFAAVRDMRLRNFAPLGNFHSHPEGPSAPSKEDKRFAYDKTASYIIISLADIKNPVLKSFRIDGDKSEEEEILIE